MTQPDADPPAALPPALLEGPTSTSGERASTPPPSHLQPRAAEVDADFFSALRPADEDRLAAAGAAVRQLDLAAWAGAERVLDLGCGAGRFLEALSAAGVVALGVEPDPAARALAAERALPVTAAVPAETTFARALAVGVFDTLPEHRADHAAATLAAALAPGGEAWIALHVEEPAGEPETAEPEAPVEDPLEPVAVRPRSSAAWVTWLSRWGLAPRDQVLSPPDGLFVWPVLWVRVVRQDAAALPSSALPSSPLPSSALPSSALPDSRAASSPMPPAPVAGVDAAARAFEGALLAHLAGCREAEGLPAVAEAAHQRRCALQPQEAEGWLGWAAHRLAQGDVKGALLLLTECTEQVPEDAEGWLARAGVALDLEDAAGVTSSLAVLGRLRLDSAQARRLKALRRLARA